MFKSFLLYIHQLPQNLLGLIVKQITNPTEMHKYCRNWYAWKSRNGVTLGQYVFLPAYSDEKTVLHEYGHCKQSLYLGWLYLIIIGLPSITWAAIWSKFLAKKGKSYYSFYTEKWADYLSGVQRD